MEAVELVHEVVAVLVLAVVLLREQLDPRHADIYAKMVYAIFSNRVLFMFRFFAITPPYGLNIEKKSAFFVDK